MTEPVALLGAQDEGIVQGGPARSLASTAAGTWAMFLGLLMLMLGNGLNSVALGVRSAEEGFGILVSGLIMSAYFAGFLAGTKFSEWALVAVGHIRVFAALASVASAVVLVQPLVVEPVTWAAMRFVFGGCMAGLYVVVESWLNDMATNATRGRLLSVYMMVSMGGLSGGQLLLNVGDPGGFSLFVVASALVSMSLVPVVLSATSAPPLTSAHPLTLRELARTAPTGVVSSFFGGAGAGTIMALGAIYGAQVGLSDGRIASLLAAPMFGGVVFQFPVGWLADRLPRLSMIIAMASLAAAASAALLAVDPDSELALVAIFVLGGGMFPLYSLTVAYTNDALRPEQMIAAGATLVRVNGSGSLFGPLVGAVAMALVGPRSIFWVILALHVVVMAFAASRCLAGAGSPRPRGHVSPFPIRSGAGAVYLLAKRRVRGPLG